MKKKIKVHLRRALEAAKDKPETRFDLLIRLSDQSLDAATIPDLRVDSKVGPIWSAVGTAASIKALEASPAVISIEGSQPLFQE